MADPLSQAATALIWLTRLPVGRVRRLPDPLPALASAVWAFPLVGFFVGACGGAVLLLGSALEIPDLACALLALGTTILMTGGIHEDGLADFADGFGGASPERALEIMRDSRIGSYGVLALLIATGLRVVLLATLMSVSPWLGVAGLVAAGALSRAGMAAGLAWLPPARRDGLGRLAGRPSQMAILPAALLGAALLIWPAMLSDGPLLAWISAIVLTVVAQVMIAKSAHRRLGGQTGDVLGAMQQAGEIGVLLALSMGL